MLEKNGILFIAVMSVSVTLLLIQLIAIGILIRKTAKK